MPVPFWIMCRASGILNLIGSIERITMNVDRLAQMYEDLAQHSARQQEPQQRDIFLVLAADAALAAGRPDQAERLRQRLLQVNPHSLLRPYASFTEALQSSDVQDYVADLRRLYPPSQAEKLLRAGNGKIGSPAALRIRETETPQPAAKLVVPRREPTPSPYERFDVPLPPGRGFDAAGTWVVLALYFLVFLGSIGLLAYVLIRPFLPAPVDVELP